MSCSQCMPKQKGLSLDGVQKNINKSRYVLIGSPNVGKSTFFNRVTWATASVGNVDGITIQTQEGKLRGTKNTDILDLPGIRDLATTTKDEEVVIKTILHSDYDGVLNIVAAPTIKRDLMLTLQLLEAGILTEVVVNMIDELENKHLNAFHLTKFLGVPVNLVVARKNIGVSQSIATLLTHSPFKKPFVIDYGEKIETIIKGIMPLLPSLKVSTRFLAIQYLTKNAAVMHLFEEWGVTEAVNNLLTENNLTLDQVKHSIYFAKKNKIETIVDHCFTDQPVNMNQENAINLSNNIRQELMNNNFKVIKRSNKIRGSENQRKLAKTRKFDSFLLQKWVAIPLFLLLVAGVYYFCFGSYACGWVVEKFKEVMEDGVGQLGDYMIDQGATKWAAAFVTDGLLNGIVTVIGFLPYILLLHICMALLEQSGLLARISVILDKSFEKYGLSGRSVITLMTGLGCSIPSVLMARNSHSKKERFITTLIAPLIACSARIVVFTWMGNALVGLHWTWVLVLGMTILSGFVALGVGYAFSNILFRAKQTFLLTELPPWRKPDFVVILKSSFNEIWQFTKRVFTIIFIVNIIMFLLANIGPIAGAITPPDIPEEEAFKMHLYAATTSAELVPNTTSYLAYISYGLKYLAFPIGLGEDWRLFASVIASAPAKELASSNLALLFGSQQGFHDAIFNAGITHLPISTIASYLIFFSFFTPCLSTDVAIKKEMGQKVLWIELLMSLVVAYGMSALVFNGFGYVEILVDHPQLIKNGLMISVTIIGILMILFNVVIGTTKKMLDQKRHLTYAQATVINKTWLGVDISAILLFVILMTTSYGLYA